MEDNSQLSTDFSVAMTNQVLQKQILLGENFVSSPISFQVMLNLIAAGSTGQTLEQLLHFLGSKDQAQLNSLSSQLTSLASNVGGDQAGEHHNAAPILSFVNGVWVDQRFGLKPSFERIARSVYNAKTEEVDFANKPDEERIKVNLWAEAETRGLIQNFLPSESVNTQTALMLANALYFKGSWNQKFNPSLTQLRDFHLLNGNIVQLPFMTADRYERHQYEYFESYRILQLPYQNGLDTRQFSMYFFLPEEKDGLPNLVKKLNSVPGFFSQNFNLGLQELREFWVPRFKFDFAFEASETMKEMGLKLPFCAGELTGMVNSEMSDRIALSRVFQKSYIEVNEEGTEAAASTAAEFSWRSAIHPTPQFVADHPFIFMIREESSRAVFFIGAVLNPLLPN